MRAPMLALATATLLATVSIASAEPKAETPATPSEDVTPAVPLKDAMPAMEIEKIRQQLGPEFSIESKELDISFDRPQDSADIPKFTPAASFGQKGDMDRELRDLAEGTRHQARHLEELAARAESESQYALADNLRDLARQKWQLSRILAGGTADLRNPVAMPWSQVALPNPYASPNPSSNFLAPMSPMPGTIFPASSTPSTCEPTNR